MELIIELPSLLPADWFDELEQHIARAGLNNVQLSEVIPPPGAAGAGFASKLKVASAVAGDIATVLALVVTLATGPKGQPPAEYCQVQVMTPDNTVEMTVPCQPSPSSDLVTAVAKVLNESKGAGPIRSVITPLKSAHPSGVEKIARP